ncbi:(d)CMP kinase [Actinotalea sp. C106]|uniref:uridine kinase family protein n=1 Tax=Actinotalea sp. C106 TaxID=2908644 RepID=UPI002027ACA7|nr:(d)CMP kinase [Actinotalea sp. C106]
MGHGVTSVSALAGQVRASAPRLGPVRLVCVDGPAGSGKTTLGAALARELGCPLIHMDDLYAGWSGLDEDLSQRLGDQLLAPLLDGRTARYQRYDWVSGSFAEWHDLPPTECLVLEGCGSGQRVVAEHAVLVAWVDAPADLRLERGLRRDGTEMREQWLRWMGLEAVHFAREGTRERADVVVDGRRDLAP